MARLIKNSDLKPLEEMFRASVFKMLKEEWKIGDDLINRLMSWRHSGFSAHNGVRVRRDDDGGTEALAQYTCPPLEDYPQYLLC